MESDIEAPITQRMTDGELKSIFLDFIRTTVQEQKQAVRDMPREEAESASVFQKRPWPDTMPMITEEELRVMPTSKHVEHHKTVSPTWAASTAKIVPKKARSSVASDMDEADFGSVITTPALGVVGNHKKPNKELVLPANTSQFAAHPSMKKMASRSKDTAVSDVHVSAPSAEPLERSAFCSVPQTTPPPASLPSRLPQSSSSSSSSSSANHNSSVTIEDVQEPPRIPDILYSREHTGFFQSDKNVKVSRSEKGQMLVVTNETGSGRERALVRSGTPQNMTEIYKLNYSVAGLQSVLAGFEQHNMVMNTAIFAAGLKHLAGLANSGEHIPVMTTSILENKKVPNDVVVPMQVVRDFLREPSPKESPCVATHLCVGRLLNILDPFTLVSFYILSRASEDVLSELTVEQAEAYRTSQHPSHRDVNGVVSAPPSLCILCIMNSSHFKVRARTMTRDTKVPPKRQLYPPVSVSVDVDGEFRQQDCCGPVLGKYNGIVSHVPMVNSEHFVEDDRVQIDGAPVRRLRWLVPAYEALSQQAHF